MRVELPAADRERLVEQRQRVARRAAGAPGDEVERLGVGLDAFPGEDVGEVADELVVREQRELEVLRARADASGSTFCGSVVASTNTTCAGGSSSVFSSVFDAAVESMCTSSMMYTLRRLGRADAEMHALDEVAHRVDAVVRRRVELDEVEERARGDRDAVLALAARLAVGAEVRGS